MAKLPWAGILGVILGVSCASVLGWGGVALAAFWGAGGMVFFWDAIGQPWVLGKGG